MNNFNRFGRDRTAYITSRCSELILNGALQCYCVDTILTFSRLPVQSNNMSTGLVEFFGNGTHINTILGPFIIYVTLKGGGGISQCDDVHIKHTPVWDNV